MIAALWLCAALAAGQVPEDEPALRRLYDGGAGFGEPPAPVPLSPKQASGPFVLRSEGHSLDSAPRYFLNLETLPADASVLIEGRERLPHKNQLATKQWVREVNRAIRARNAGRPAAERVAEWRYRRASTGRPSPYACIAYAASLANDWWSLQLGRELPERQSVITGRVERGLDASALELAYRERERSEPEGSAHYRTVPPIGSQIRNLPIVYHPRGYAELLADAEPFEGEDPATGRRLRLDPEENAMEGRYLELFSTPVGLRTPSRRARELAAALDQWGVVFVQLSDRMFPRILGEHSVVVIGHFCLDEDAGPYGKGPGTAEPNSSFRGAGRFRRCGQDMSDEQWGEQAYFILHDVSGDFPATKNHEEDGSPAYRAVKVSSVDKAYVFPHTFRVLAEPAGPGHWRLRAVNHGGRPVSVLSWDAGGAVVAADGESGALLSGAPGERVELAVAARYYFEPDGAARRFSLLLDSEGPAEAFELARTAPPPGFRERLAERLRWARPSVPLQSP